jgi:hypothetical protein
MFPEVSRELNMNIYKYLVIQKSLPREVDSPWRQAPVTLEDSLGFLVPIPLELVTSWKVWLKYHLHPDFIEEC